GRTVRTDGFTNGFPPRNFSVGCHLHEVGIGYARLVFPGPHKDVAGVRAGKNFRVSQILRPVSIRRQIDRAAGRRQPGRNNLGNVRTQLGSFRAHENILQSDERAGSEVCFRPRTERDVPDRAMRPEAAFASVTTSPITSSAGPCKPADWITLATSPRAPKALISFSLVPFSITATGVEASRPAAISRAAIASALPRPMNTTTVWFGRASAVQSRSGSAPSA